MKRIPYAGSEHQRREIEARDRHHGEGCNYYGEGCSVMTVARRSLPGERWPRVEVYGPGDTAPSGADFVYADFFQAAQEPTEGRTTT
jgi:hypothetical protein